MFHDVGDVVTLWVVFRDQTGAQADPDNVTLTVRDPHGGVTQVTNVAAAAEDEEAAEEATNQTLDGVVGVYRADLELDLSGRWRYKWEGTGAVDEVEASRLYVRRDMVGTAES